LPKATVEGCENADAVLFGSVGGPKWEHSPPLNNLSVAHCCHCVSISNCSATCVQRSCTRGLEEFLPTACGHRREWLRYPVRAGADRGIYFGQPKGREGSGQHEKAFDTEVYHRFEIERIAHIAFERA
jgi:3-isopropylmalate dehydrogenase